MPLRTGLLAGRVPFELLGVRRLAVELDSHWLAVKSYPGLNVPSTATERLKRNSVGTAARAN
jgi:hypothetical protein